MERANYIAFDINAKLPDDYKRELVKEEMHVMDLLDRSGLTDRKILLIGGAGYIGTVLIKHLLDRGYNVRCLDLLLYHTHSCIEPYLANPNFEFVPADYTDADKISATLEGVSDVVMLGGLVGDPITKKYPDESHKINHQGYEDLIDQLNGRGLNKVIFISTCSNYGLMQGDEIADENSELNPLSAYAHAKVAIEKRLLAIGESVDFQPTVLRFATAFGLSPRMRFDLTISQFTREIAVGDDVLVYDADTWRPYCHVLDFSEVIRRVLEAPKERVTLQVFNAGGDKNNQTKRMIIEAVLGEVPSGKVAYQEHGSDPRNYRVNFSKIKNALYFEPKHDVLFGIRELITALDQGQFSNIAEPASFYGNYEINYC
jgi:nucleoside-diphosphate-sugar epimerase